MNQEIEVFVKLLEKNFSNQVIDEFLLVKVEKEYPSNLKATDIILEDPRSLLESCFSIWDISSRLLVQDKKNLISNGKYILRLRLLCCRLISFIFQSELKTEEVLPPSTKNQGKETIKSVHYHDVPILFHDSDIAQETLKMYVRCAQNCFEVEDTQKLYECLNLLNSLEENFSISEYILKHHQNLQLYLLMNQWILQYYANEDQQIPKSLIKKKFPQILSLISANPSLHEKDQIITIILIIVCKLMIASDENNVLGMELANYSLKILEDYTHLLSNKEDLNQLFQKILVYSSIRQQNSTAPLQLYEKLTGCSEDKLTEYLKLLVEVKLKITTNVLSKEDLDLLAKKIEFVITQHDIEPEEYCAFVEELTLVSGTNCKGFFLAQFIESISNHAKFKTKKVDLVAIRLIKHWIDKIQTTAEGDSIHTEGLQEHLQIILKSILRDRISSKKLHILERNMVKLAKLLTLQKSYKLSFDFLENLIEFIRKDHTSMLKEACILQIENCYYLKHTIGVKRAFENYDSLEPDKEEFLYNVCKLKTLITLAMANPDEELAHDIPLFLSTLIESKNFDDKAFFLLMIELLQNNLGGVQNKTVMLKEFFIVLRKGLEKVILHHEKHQQQDPEKSSFPLFKLFCVYLSHFEELFNKYRGEKTHFSESLVHESIGTTLEIGFLVLETFRIFCEKFVLKSDDSNKTRFLNPTWLVQQNELDYLDNFYWNLAIFVGYLNLDLNFALRFIFLSLKMKLTSIILNNLGIFGDFVGDNNPNNLEIDLFLQFCLDRIKEIYIEEDKLLSLIKTLLLYVSNTLCLLKNKENSKSENLIDNAIVLKCLELNQTLIANSGSDTKAHSYLQYHCLVEFEYRIIVCPETTRMFLDDFCLQMNLEPQLFLVFADIANNLNQKQEYLLCLRTHVRASLKDNATPFLSVECYVELIEFSQGIEDEICYLRQLLTFLDDNIQALKSQTTSQDVIQELEYLYAFCQNKNMTVQNDEKRELYEVQSLLLEEIQERINMLVVKDF